MARRNPGFTLIELVISMAVLGLVSFGFVAMIAYVIAGPDGTRADEADRRVGTVLRA